MLQLFETMTCHLCVLVYVMAISGSKYALKAVTEKKNCENFLWPLNPLHGTHLQFPLSPSRKTWQPLCNNRNTQHMRWLSTSHSACILVQDALDLSALYSGRVAQHLSLALLQCLILLWPGPLHHLEHTYALDYELLHHQLVGDGALPSVLHLNQEKEGTGLGTR